MTKEIYIQSKGNFDSILVNKISIELVKDHILY